MPRCQGAKNNLQGFRSFWLRVSKTRRGARRKKIPYPLPSPCRATAPKKQKPPRQSQDQTQRTLRRSKSKTPPKTQKTLFRKLSHHWEIYQIDLLYPKIIDFLIPAIVHLRSALQILNDRSGQSPVVSNARKVKKYMYLRISCTSPVVGEGGRGESQREGRYPGGCRRRSRGTAS